LLLVFDRLQPVQAVELVIFAYFGDVGRSGNVVVCGFDGATFDMLP
jgi:hypothetical protein